jgi:predicted lipoprotein with Yx(FWY)xxD motif
VKRLLPLAALAAITAVAALVVSGCGSSKTGGGYSASGAPASAAPASAGAADSGIGVTSGSLGKFLVDAKGRTLYLFEADKPNKSNCSSACLSVWPPLSASGKAPSVSGGAVAGKLGVTKLAGGKSIVTYNGHPLYYYVGDKKPGDTAGQGLNQFGAGWYVVNPSGDKIDKG